MATPRKSGRRGPVPKRSDQRRRRNADSGPRPIGLSVTGTVIPPEADPDWHPAILRFYESLKTAGQNSFYETSDWGLIQFLCFRESLNLKSSRPSAQMSGFFIAALSDLLVTEGARRRLRVELRRDVPAEPPHVAIMARYRTALGYPPDGPDEFEIGDRSRVLSLKHPPR